MIISTCRILFALLLLQQPLSAEQLRFDSARDWRQWQLPAGAVELTPTGIIRPIRIRKTPNASLNASDFGGGIRNAGSNIREALLTIDGDETTGWSIDPADDPQDWFIEVDLGRGVSANSVTLVFAEDAPPFELFDILLSTGEPETDFIAAPIEGSLIYRVKQRFKENTRHGVTFVIEALDETPIQFVRIEPLLHVPGARLVEIEVETIGDNIALGLLERGGIVDININLASNSPQPLGKARALVDGDLYSRWRAGAAPGKGAGDVNAHMILDLGAVYSVDLVRVIGGVAVRSGFGGGITTSHYVSRRRWSFRFYELMTSDGSLSPDGTRIWTRHFAGEAPVAERRRGLVDHHFDLIPTRYIRIFWKFWGGDCSCQAGGTTDEIMIFGEGYPREVVLRSPLIDMKGNKNLNTVSWQGDTPPNTNLEIRTRTGNEVVESYVFHDKNGKEVTEKRYGKLIPSFRGSIDTLTITGADWSPWSKIYTESGQGFQSPSPRRYLEIQTQMISDASNATATLDWLNIDFSPPLARSAVGEIHPLAVQPGTLTEFTYYLRPEQTQAGGFDRLAVEASAPLQFIAAVLDGATVAVESAPTATGFRVTFPEPIRSNQLVELRFESSVFLQSTRFDLFLEDSRAEQSIRQRVDSGNATDQVESNSNVVSLPVSRNLLLNADFGAGVLTPNGDGINDEMVISADVVNVLAPRPLRLRLYDLAGRQLSEQRWDVQAGLQQLSWGGRDDYGQMVPPGLYLLELHIGGDAGEQRVRRVVSVVY